MADRRPAVAEFAHSPRRQGVGGSYHAALTLLVLVLAAAASGCGAEADPCKVALTATFEQVPNGPLPGTPIGGLDITAAGTGAVTVLRDTTNTPPTAAVFLAGAGRMIVRPHCDARSVELAFDASDAPLVIFLFAGDDGGSIDGDGGSSQPFYRVEASALSSAADAVTGFKRATVKFPDGGKIRRVELLGGTAGGMMTAGALVRLITVAP